MYIVELKAIEYLKLIKEILREKYRYLLLGVNRSGEEDAERYFGELEKYWESLNDLTGEKIAFLNFSDKFFAENYHYPGKTLCVGGGSGIESKGFISPHLEWLGTTLENSLLRHTRWDEIIPTLNRYGIKAEQPVRLDKRFENSFEETAGQLLRQLNRKECDVPFIYLFDLRKNKEYFFRVKDIYSNKKNLYTFVKDLVIQIENGEEIMDFSNKQDKIFITKTLDVKFFIASSNELIEARNHLERQVNPKRELTKRDGIDIVVEKWENKSEIIPNSFRSQDEYNLILRRCRLVVVLLKNRIGKYTLEEFEKALKAYKIFGKPKIVIYQFRPDTIQPDSDDAKERWKEWETLEKFIKELRNLNGKYEIEYFHSQVTDTNELWTKINLELDRIIADIKEHGNEIWLSDGSMYIGETYKEQPNGKGKKIYPNGDIYIGEFIDGAANGKGTFKSIRGTIIEGHFVNDKTTGEVKCTYSTGATYKGEFLEGKPHGTGIFICSEYKYEGEFADGLKNGEGIMTYSTGATYKGEFLNNKFNGTGIFVCSKYKYEGEFTDGKKTGKGKLTNFGGEIDELENAKSE